VNDSIRLIVGLGNPGSEYENTRHNAGAWLLEEIARHYGVQLKPEKKIPRHQWKGQYKRPRRLFTLPHDLHES